MGLREELNDLARKYVGKEAIAIQKQNGRGLWIIRPGEKASYVLLKDVSNMIRFRSAAELQDMIDSINEADPDKQVVVWFDIEKKSANFATVVDIK